MNEIPTLQQLRSQLEEERLHAQEQCRWAKVRIEMIDAAIAERALVNRRSHLKWIVATAIVVVASVAFRSFAVFVAVSGA